ncbi:MAG: site-2 protease family protein [Aigarchaeota archaeon]|nr:site-2 protease family protein [Aigarchaeota archaeon]MCX8192446.1 site-2 protease family protein [Nitrososphaeria archaeon]MDW7986652.1 site-2 protease family protein [Nitrososphaerota archaeon]
MVAYIDNIENVKTIVSKHFNVLDVYFDVGVLTFKVYDEDIKEKFRELYRELKDYQLVPTATKEDGVIFIRLFPKPRVEPPLPKSRTLPLLLFLATLGTVSIDGYLRSSTTVYEIITGKTGLIDKILDGFIFTIALLAIIGIHEFGHKISAKIDYIESSPPYFIPGIPTMIPTFGAVIFQKSPAINRDDMFDIGVSGPIAGFLVSIGVLFASFSMARWVPVTEYNVIVESIERGGGILLPSPLIFYLVRPLFGRPDMVPLFTIVGFAAWLGMLITALNLFPAWQLDGGRIFRSFLSRKQHKIAGYVSVVILAVTGYFFFALLILLMMPRTPDIAPLDQVSPLSKRRKIAVSLIIAIIILTFIPLRTF